MLISRPAGKESYLALQPLLKDLAEKDEIEIDFAGVSVLTPSWADEFISPLSVKFQGKVRLLNTENPSVKATLKTLEESRKRRTQ